MCGKTTLQYNVYAQICTNMTMTKHLKMDKLRHGCIGKCQIHLTNKEHLFRV